MYRNEKGAGAARRCPGAWVSSPPLGLSSNSLPLRGQPSSSRPALAPGPCPPFLSVPPLPFLMLGSRPASVLGSLPGLRLSPTRLRRLKETSLSDAVWNPKSRQVRTRWMPQATGSLRRHRRQPHFGPSSASAGFLPSPLGISVRPHSWTFFLERNS